MQFAGGKSPRPTGCGRSCAARSLACGEADKRGLSLRQIADFPQIERADCPRNIL